MLKFIKIIFCIYLLLHSVGTTIAKDFIVSSKTTFAFQKLENIYFTTHKYLQKNENWKVIQEVNKIKNFGIRFSKLPKKQSKTKIVARDLYLQIIYNRAQSHYNLKRYKKAILDFQYILENQDIRFKTFSPAYIYAEHIALAFYDSAEKEKAISILKQQIELLKNQTYIKETEGLELNSELSFLYEGLRKIYFWEKDYNTALKYAEKSQKLDPKEYSFFRLGLCYMAVQKIEKSYQWFFKGLDTNQTSKQDFQKIIKEWEDYFQAERTNKKEIGNALWFLYKKNLNQKKFKKIFSFTNPNSINTKILNLIQKPQKIIYRYLVEFFYYHKKYKKMIYFAKKWNHDYNSEYSRMYIHFPYSLYGFELGKDEIALRHFFIGFNYMLNLYDKDSFKKDIEQYKNTLVIYYEDLEKRKINNTRINTTLFFFDLLNRQRLNQQNVVKTIEVDSNINKIKNINSKLLYFAGIYSLKQNDRKLTKKYLDILYSKKNEYIKQTKNDPLYASYFKSFGKDSLAINRQIPSKQNHSKIIVPIGHQNRITKLLINSSGKRVYSSSYDNNINIWNRKGKLIRTISAHEDEVRDIALSSDDKNIISVSADKSMKIWDKNGNLIQTISFEQGENTSANSIIVSPNGLLIATGHENGRIKIWNINGKLLKDFEAHRLGISKVIFSSDSRKIISASYDNTFKIWNLNGYLLNTVKEKLPVIHLYQNPINNIILVGTIEKIILYDINKFQRIHEQKFADLKDAVFSKDGQSIFLCSKDKLLNLKIYNSNIKVILHTKESEISKIQVHKNKKLKLIYLAFEDNSIKIFSDNGKLLKLFQGKIDNISELTFLSDKNTLINQTFYDSSFKAWNLKGNLITNFQGHTDNIISMAISKDGKRIVTGSKDHTVKVWNRNGKLLLNLTGHTAPVNAVAITPDNKTIIGGSDVGRSIRIWNENGEMLEEIGIETKGVYYAQGSHEYTMGVNYLAISPNGKTIICASGEMILLYSLKGKLLKAIQALEGMPILSLNIDKNQKSFYVTQGDMQYSGGLRWDFDGNELPYPKDTGHYLTYSENGKIFITSYDYQQKVEIRSKDGNLVKTLTGILPIGILQTRYGNTMIVYSDNKIELYNLKGELIKSIDNEQVVKNVTVSPDKEKLLVVNADNTIHVWDIHTNQKLATMISFQDGSAVIYTPEAKYDYYPTIQYIKIFEGNELLKSKEVYKKYYQRGLLNKILN